MYIETIKKFIEKYIGEVKIADLDLRPRAYRHWEMLLIGFIILDLVLLAFGVYLFLEVNKGNIFLVEQSQEVRVQSIDRGKLQELLTSFEVRDSLFESRKRSPMYIEDPSQ